MLSWGAKKMCEGCHSNSLERVCRWFLRKVAQWPVATGRPWAKAHIDVVRVSRRLGATPRDDGGSSYFVQTVSLAEQHLKAPCRHFTSECTCKAAFWFLYTLPESSGHRLPETEGHYLQTLSSGHCFPDFVVRRSTLSSSKFRCICWDFP